MCVWCVCVWCVWCVYVYVCMCVLCVCVMCVCGVCVVCVCVYAYVCMCVCMQKKVNTSLPPKSTNSTTQQLVVEFCPFWVQCRVDPYVIALQGTVLLSWAISHLFPYQVSLLVILFLPRHGELCQPFLLSKRTLQKKKKKTYSLLDSSALSLSLPLPFATPTHKQLFPYQFLPLFLVVAQRSFLTTGNPRAFARQMKEPLARGNLLKREDLMFVCWPGNHQSTAEVMTAVKRMFCT